MDGYNESIAMLLPSSGGVRIDYLVMSYGWVHTSMKAELANCAVGVQGMIPARALQMLRRVVVADEDHYTPWAWLH